MGKYSAEALSLAGDKYMGRKYSEMDCQAFVENSMRDVGLMMDLKGSNAWYREVMKNGWVGSPEECKKVFGSIPKGALLFIHAFDKGEEQRGYHDGLGNAKHIGINTDRSGDDMVQRARDAGANSPEKWNYGDGAIHSSSVREHVTTSKFAGKSINGGWNKVGLYSKFTYGEAIDRQLAEITGENASTGNKNETQEVTGMYEAILEGGKINSPINIRKMADGGLQDKLNQGTRVTVLAESGDWCKISYQKGNRTVTGFVKGEFVNVADDAPSNPDNSDAPAAISETEWDSKTVSITLNLTETAAAAMLPVLDKLVREIVNKVGRG